MNKQFLAGYFKRAAEAGIPPQAAEEMLQAAIAEQGSAPAEPEVSPAEPEVSPDVLEEALGAGAPAPGSLSDEDIQRLSQAIATQLVEIQESAASPSEPSLPVEPSLPEVAKEASIKQTAAYVEGFFKSARDHGYNGEASYAIFKQAYDATVAPEPTVLNEKEASAYWEGVFEKAAEYGIGRAEVTEFFRNNN